jgi:hypothetical protein
MSEQIPQQDPPTVEPSEEANAVTNPFARIIGVITDPVPAMRGAAAKTTDWWIPLILLIVGVVIFNLIAGDVIRDFSIDQMRERINGMVADGRISQEQADQIVEQQSSGGAMTIGLYAGPIVSVFVMRLVMTLLALLVGNVILGGASKFGVYWNVLWWAMVIGVLGMIVSSILMKLTGDIQGAQLGLGILTKGNPDGIAHKILQVFSVFPIWEGIVAGFGVAAAANVAPSKGMVWMLAVYIGFALITSIAFGQSMI